MKRSVRYLFMCSWLVVLTGVPFPVRGAPVSFGIKVSFDNYTQNEPLTNFPVLVVFSNGMARTGFNYDGFLSTNGYDLRFWTNRWRVGTQLQYEIESWNTAGVSHVWVQVPTLTNHSTIWASWGDKTNAAQLACTTNGAVWSEGFHQVYHLGQTNAQDSTTNRMHGTLTNSAVTVGAGIAGPALVFNETNRGAVTLPFYDRNTAPYTLSAWAKTVDNDGAFIGWIFYDPQDHILMQTRAGKLRFHRNWYMSISWMESSQIVSDGQWHYCVAVKATNDAGRLYVDGVQVASIASVGTTRGGGFSFLGRTKAYVDAGVPDDYYFDGILDEVRVCDADRSSNWIWACWLNVVSNAFFNTYNGYDARPGLVITVR